MFLALGGLCWGSTAYAFCREMTCELGKANPEIECPHDTSGCVSSGAPLHWASSCLTYAIQKDGSVAQHLSAEETLALVEQAFGLWANAACPGGGTPSFSAQFQGYVSCAQQEAVCDRPNVNVIMYHDDNWDHDGADIAVTTPTAGVSTGLIVDADLEINSQVYTFATPTTTGSTQLSPVLAHELGHFLGLGHSRAPGALMSKDYMSLSLGSDPLTADDIAGVCALYPPNQSLACGDPGKPSYDACLVDPSAPPECQLASVHQDATGCSCRMAARSTSGGGAAFAFGLLVLSRLRRSSRSSKRRGRLRVW